MSVTLRFLGIRWGGGGEEISRCLGRVFRRKWVQDMKWLSDRKVRFIINSIVYEESRA